VPPSTTCLVVATSHNPNVATIITTRYGSVFAKSPMTPAPNNTSPATMAAITNGSFIENTVAAEPPKNAGAKSDNRKRDDSSSRVTQ